MMIMIIIIIITIIITIIIIIIIHTGCCNNKIRSWYNQMDKRGIEKYRPKNKKADEYASSTPSSSGCGQIVHQKSRGRKGYDKC